MSYGDKSIRVVAKLGGDYEGFSMKGGLTYKNFHEAYTFAC